MTPWNWKPERAQGVWRTGPVWLRPFLAAVPWITVLLLVLMFHMVGGTLASSEGVLFDLPDSSELEEGEPASLVALIPGMFMTTVIVSFILWTTSAYGQPYGFGVPLRLALGLGIATSAVFAAYAVVRGRRLRA